MGLSFRDVVSTARRNDMPDRLRCQLAFACRFCAPSVPHHFKTLRFAPARSPFRFVAAGRRFDSLRPSTSSASLVCVSSCQPFLLLGQLSLAVVNGVLVREAGKIKTVPYHFENRVAVRMLSERHGGCYPDNVELAGTQGHVVLRPAVRWTWDP
jgi:hypothetical protein